MKIRSRNLILALGGLAGLSLSVNAHAQSTLGPLGPYVITDQVTNFTSALSLPKFNPALGTLESVELDYFVDGTATGSVTNTTGSTKTFAVTDTVTANLLGTSATGSTSANVVGLGAGKTQSIGTLTVSGSSFETLTSGFSSFIGTGNISIPVTTNAVITGNPAGVTENITTMAGGTAYLTYTYDPIPEASTLLGFTALLGMGVIRLRRRSTKA